MTPPPPALGPTLPLARALALALALAAPLGCSKSERANEVTLARVCAETAKNTIEPSTLQRLEMRFFTDRRSRDLLSLDRLKLKSLREVSSSATLGVYELLFEFVTAQGAPLVLRNDERTGGVSLDGPNQVMFKGVCEVQWSHFKGRPFQKSFAIKAVNLDSRLRALDVE